MDPCQTMEHAPFIKSKLTLPPARYPALGPKAACPSLATGLPSLVTVLLSATVLSAHTATPPGPAPPDAVAKCGT